MQRKPGYPVSNCNIKMPDGVPPLDAVEEEEPVHRRQQLINFGHTQWGFNNWSWSVTKQDLDFAEMTSGKYSAGVVAFVCVTVKSVDIHRENIGYATALAPYKGAAIHNARKCAVTNALRETLLSFGGKVATDLLELLDAHRSEAPNQNQNMSQNQNMNQNQNQNANLNQNPIPNQKHVPPDAHENNQNPTTPKQSKVKVEELATAKTSIIPAKNAPNPPVARAHPMPANLPANMPPRPTHSANVNANVKQHHARPPDVRPPAPQPAPLLRPNSNEVEMAEMSEKLARAERKRRQKQAQEEFRLKQMMKQREDTDDKLEANKNSSLDKLLMEIPSQLIVIEDTDEIELAGKRKSPSSDGGAAKRRVFTKLDIVDNK